MPINVVTPKSIWLSENELEAYVTTFVSGGILVYYQRNSIVEPFGAPEEIFLNGITLGSIAGASLNSTQTELILYAAGYGVITFNRTSSNSFDYVGPLLSSSNLNTSAGQLSKDDLTYFLGINNAGFGASINQLERSTIADAFSSSALQEISDLNEPLPSNIQPTMSSDLEWVVFVRNFDGIWAGNELYISHKVSLSVIKNETKNNFTVIPNPTSGKFTITMATSLSSNEDYTIEIFDSTGKLLLENKMATEVNLSDYAAGIYFAKITGGTFSEVQKIIRN
ncbi:MAG: T9SS type A sorting domain-containing protein [Flavobacterium sp.]|nr:T9SS type A sorting domain-containing protein [Flavobacterium sp.]